MFLLALFAAVLISKTVTSSTIHRQERIIGGSYVTIFQYPYQVSIRIHDVHFCGGSIISKNAVLTAAHCTINFTPGDLSIRAGSSYRSYGGKLLQVSRIENHPLFNLSKDDHDISVVFLKENLDFSPEIQPVRLPQPNVQVPENTTAVVTGWGYRIPESTVKPEELMAAKVKVYSRKSCVLHYPDDAITETMMCAGLEDGSVDSCQGDSGGPLVADGVLIGVVSWGYSCGVPHHPGVYTNVAVLRNYIRLIANV